MGVDHQFSSRSVWTQISFLNNNKRNVGQNAPCNPLTLNHPHPCYSRRPKFLASFFFPPDQHACLTLYVDVLCRERSCGFRQWSTIVLNGCLFHMNLASVAQDRRRPDALPFLSLIGRTLTALQGLGFIFEFFPCYATRMDGDSLLYEESDETSATSFFSLTWFTY